MSDLRSKGQRFWKPCQRWSLSWGGQITALLLLLLRLVWGMWQWRDMTSGDTTYYYQIAVMHWLNREPIEFVYSPLYEAFYGWFGITFPDAFAATILHRIVILALLSFAVLLLARKLLPKAMAWLVAAWWLVLPIDWNALYEVHLFGFLPLVVGCWLVGMRRRTWALGLGLAAVWTCALLLRNEYALSVAMLTLCCVAHEWMQWRRTSRGVATFGKGLFRLALPSLLVLGLSIAVWHHDWRGWKKLQKQFHQRHTLNMAQVYPFSYQQRHPEWKKDPWTQGRELMNEKFGEANITFSEAFKKNPNAMWEHMIWHVRLLPAGMQLGLFNGHWGADGPDFTPPRQQPVKAAVLSGLLLAVLAAGAFCLWQRRSQFGRFVKSQRFWSWLGLLCLMPPCVVAILTQRPRPSYLFPLNFLVMALTGLCLYAVLRRLKAWRCFQAALPIFMVVIVAAASPEKMTAQLYEGQPLRLIYQRLAPFASYLQGKRLFASRQFPGEVDHLLNFELRKSPGFTLGHDMEQSAVSFQEALEGNRVAVLYLNEADLDQPGVKAWLAGEDAKKWTVLARHERDGQYWMFLNRSLPPKQKPAEVEDK